MFDHDKQKYLFGMVGIVAAFLLIIFFINVSANSFAKPPANLASTPTVSSSVGACQVEASDCTTSAISKNNQAIGLNIQPQSSNVTVIYMFWGDGCPHCAAAKPFLQGLDQGSDQVELRMYEVWYVEENQALFTKMAGAYGFEPHGVPTIFIGKQHWEGYSDQIQKEIQAAGKFNIFLSAAPSSFAIAFEPRVCVDHRRVAAYHERPLGV